MVWRANVNNCRANEDNSAKNIIFGQPKIVCAQIRRIKFYVCAQHKIVCAQKRRIKKSGQTLRISKFAHIFDFLN